MTTLPPLPPDRRHAFDAAYSADQMRAYGEACAAAERARLSGEIERLRTEDAEHRAAFGAIYLALRPSSPDRSTWHEEITRLRADAERLQWLEDCAMTIDMLADPDNLVQIWHSTINSTPAVGRTLRAAIDAARAALEEP